MKISVELTAEQWAEILWAADNPSYPNAKTADAALALYEELSKKGLPGW